MTAISIRITHSPVRVRYLLCACTCVWCVCMIPCKLHAGQCIQPHQKWSSRMGCCHLGLSTMSLLKRPSHSYGMFVRLKLTGLCLPWKSCKKVMLRLSLRQRAIHQGGFMTRPQSPTLLGKQAQVTSLNGLVISQLQLLKPGHWSDGRQLPAKSGTSPCHGDESNGMTRTI